MTRQDTTPTPERQPADAAVRVLWLVKGLGRGGAEMLLVSAARHRDRSGIDPHVAYVLAHKDALVSAIEAEGTPVTCLGDGRGWDPRWVIRLRRLLRTQSFEVVHSHSPIVAIATRLVALTMRPEARPRLVSTEHNTWQSHHWLTRALDRLTFGRDDAHMAVSDAVRRSLPGRLGVDVEVVLQGVDVDEVHGQADRRSVREELGIGGDEIVIGTVANIRAPKAYPDLLEAARRVIERVPSARFVAVGHGPQREMIERLRDDLGLGDRFRFLGFRTDAVRLVSGFDLFCSASHHEGLPVSMMEALVLGVPVVATDVGGVGELIVDDVSGVLIPSSRPDLLADAMIMVATDPVRRERLAQGATAAGAGLTVADSISRAETLYRELAQERSPHTSAGGDRRPTGSVGGTKIRIRRWLVGLVRRLSPIGAELRRRGTMAARAGDRMGLRAGGLRAGPAISRRRAGLRRELGGPRSIPLDRSSVTIDGRTVTVLTLGAGAGLAGAGVAEAGLAEAGLPESGRAGAGDDDLICLVADTTEPLSDDWLEQLAAAVNGPVVAAAPASLHPARPFPNATRDDLAVRSAGIEIQLSAAGTPRATSIAAGQPVNMGGEPYPVQGVSGAALLVTRAALAQAGGVQMIEGDLDATLIDLTARLRSGGDEIVVVPDCLVLDPRPVVSRRSLTEPVDVDGKAWRTVIERHGPAVVRPLPGPLRLGTEPIGEVREPERPRPQAISFALTVAAPSRKVAARWGDWHLAQGLAAALERAGHRVRVQTADQADSLASRCCDVHVVIRGLHRVPPTPGQRQVIWIISHPEDIEVTECDSADLVLVASPRFAAHLGALTETPVKVMLQATDPARFRPVPVDPRHRHAVTIVAKSRDVLRPMVTAALAAGIRPAIYGAGWEGLVDPDLVVGGYVPNQELPAIYSSADVVLNDHWDTMRAWGFVSNRLFDVLACGTPVVSDDMSEVQDLFGDFVPRWSSAAELGEVVSAIIRDPAAARARLEPARQLVLDWHTFDHRAAELIEALRETDTKARHQL